VTHTIFVEEDIEIKNEEGKEKKSESRKERRIFWCKENQFVKLEWSSSFEIRIMFWQFRLSHSLTLTLKISA
jgi:hypothetical protein